MVGSELAVFSCDINSGGRVCVVSVHRVAREPSVVIRRACCKLHIERFALGSDVESREGESFGVVPFVATHDHAPQGSADASSSSQAFCVA